MSQPEENREKTGKTDSTMNRRQAPPLPMTNGGEVVDDIAARHETEGRTERGKRSR